MSARLADRAVHDFLRGIAHPGEFSGGGSVAALTGAGAAATALLVIRLNMGRKAHAEIQDELAAHEAALEGLYMRFVDLADEDIAVLQELLEAHRETKSDPASSRYAEVLVRAARSTCDIAQAAEDLLLVLEPNVERSSRFTVSDLGAAAALADGACRAALLTAEVNAALLAERDDVPEAISADFLAEIERLRTSVNDKANGIEQATSKRLLGDLAK